MTRQELEAHLREFPKVAEVAVAGNGRLVAKMSVRDFDDVDEADRQARVYAFLRARVSDEDMETIEYVITNAPGDPQE